jgi:MFS transporter, DHA1 family, multidrug resistance protein
MPRPLPPHSFRFLALIALFGGLPALGTDIALPAVPPIAAAFGVPEGAIGLTLSAFMVGFAGSPLVYGPLSDRFGRRPVILIATAIYAVAALACALATNFEALVAFRFIQGCGAGASRAVSPAIIRDLFTGSVARAKQSYVQVMQLFAPLSAPTIGAALLVLTDDWRTIYGFLSFTGALAFGLMAAFYGESFTPGAQNRLSPRQLARNYTRVFSHPQSRKFLLVQSLMFGCLFSYVSGSPLVGMGVYGLSPAMFGATFALTASGIVTGSFVNGRLNARGIDPRRPLAAGLGVGMGSTLLLTAFALSGHLPLALFLGLVVLVTVSFGLISGNAVQLALEPMGDIAGLTASVVSASSLAFGATMGVVVSLLHAGTPVATATAMAACSCAAVVVYRKL